jgi:gluconolactonase
MADRISADSQALIDAGLVSRDATLDSIASGFTYTEGPVWIPGTQELLFHDIPADLRYSWSEAAGTVVELESTEYSNGMTLDANGDLIVCEAGANRVTRTTADGSVEVLASHFDGKELNSPNDVVVRSAGDIYFTDPAYGRIPVYGFDRPQQLDFQGIYRVAGAGGEPELLSSDLIQPNGLAFSPDESTLYVADSESGEVSAFGVDETGRLAKRRVFFAEAGVPLPFEDARNDNLPSGYLDGMACDERGNLYQTGRGGIWVIGPGGDALGVLALPEDVSNLAFGGEDGRTLFIACRSNIYRVSMQVAGASHAG